jgi:histidine triad (HIT) family protein
MIGSESADCIFCKIIAGQMTSSQLYEDEACIVIRDIRPQAKVHLLVIPKEHIASLDQAFSEQGTRRSDLIGKLFEVGTKVARQQGLLPEGFRAVINHGKNGGQTVFHLHLHILGGEPLREYFG